MATAAQLLRQGLRDEIWRKYCGFLDLSLEEFMESQERLLMEQIGLLSKSELGRKLLGDKVPTSVKEFRESVPLTTYGDYLPHLDEKREDVLPEKPDFWIRTSGRSEAGLFKWAPYPKRMLQAGTELAFASVIFATCHGKGDFSLEENDRFLYGMAPPPYISGMLPYGLLWEFPFKFLPSVEEAEKMSFQERIEKGFELSFREGLDVFFGISSVLVRIGDQFGQASGKVRISPILFHPKSLFRLMRGLLRSKLAKRPMIPADLWDVKGVISGGTDTAIYRDKIKYYWGKEPIEMYGGTEINFIATQTWDYEGMTFVPYTGFLEFIPEEEHLKSKRNPSYQPRPVLLNEVEAGEKYELVVTNFRGGIYVRYRIGDMIKITALRNDNLDIDIPQMIFWARADDIIDLAGFSRLTETIIWQAIEDSGIGCKEWTARKEVREQQPMLHLYIELLEESRWKLEEVENALHNSLKDVDPSYREIEEMLGLKPLHVTLLRPGTFQRYIEDREAVGTELAHLKPAHMRPSDEVINRLLVLGST
ncbi:MAG: GH3 auxin-responsive promoter family protein [Anaerolineae bacterium]